MLINLVLILFLSGHSLSQLANRPPVFNRGSDSFEVDENEIGQVLTTLTATDPDGDPIIFSIDIDDYFEINVLNPNTVEVRSKQGIDYERNAQVQFAVTATDQVSNSQTTIDITVNVRDLNDNGPVFVQGGRSSFVIAESEDVGFRIENAFSVTDADTGINADTSVTCFTDTQTPQSSLACDTFDVSSRRVGNGNYAVDIVLKTKLDFETLRSYILAVKAENDESPFNFTTKNFAINVLDSQDQDPVFIRAPYSPRPVEEEPVGTVIEVISVRDGDRDAQPPRKLGLTLLNDTRNWLDLSKPQNNSGVFTSNLTVRSRMDREEFSQPVYTVAVQVSELFPNNTVDASATATSYINLQIFDINDHAPEFWFNNREPLDYPLTLDVPEGLGVNTNLPGFLVSVIDIDIPPNNRFDVRMEGFGSDTFELSPAAGVGSAVLSLYVKKEANLDYEKEEYRRMQLTLIASDIAGNDSLSRTATVVINLIDKNDNSPYFLQSLYNVRVGEEVLPGAAIIDVNGTDADSGSFGRVSYSLGQISDYVRINGETGVVYLISQPPEGSNLRYEVELVITDGGGKSTTATLIVNFNNEFPEAPKFDSHIYNATVYENRTTFNNDPVRVRAVIVRDEAVDEDSPRVLYQIISGNTPDQVFQLHPENGRLTLRRPLLKRDGRQFDLTVEASDGELTDTAQIIVQLLDFNDFTPTFPFDEYARVIPETTPVGTSILNITAQDLDGADEEGGRITYTILSGDNTQRFYIDPASGSLIVNAELDFDSQPVFIMQVKAEDNGSPIRSDVVLVNITLTDINNRLPRFSNDLYVQYMNENDPPGTRVLQVNAFDVDRGSSLRYSIVTNSYRARNPFNGDVTTTVNFDYRNVFSINPQTGLITTLLPFNRAAVSYVSFDVQVVDVNGEVPRYQQDLAEVQVHIRQEGVGVPEFLNEPWTVTDQRIVVNVPEGRHGLLLTLIARDSLTHAQITRFREVAGDPDNLFTVTVNGDVIMTRALDYESLLSRTTRFIVEAITQTGETTTATVEVNLVNVNDNSPSFNQNSYSYTLTEGVFTRNIRLGSVSVSDADGDTNFIYRLTGRDASYFYIDNQGIVYVRNGTVIDAESVTRYDLYVEVTDRSYGGRTSYAPLTVTVGNTNEHYPVCVQPLFTFFIPKSISSGVSFGQVLATDDDVADSVEYFMDSNNGGASFSVDRTTGVVSTLFPLQASDRSSYDFSVRARDTTFPNYETICRVNVIVFSPETTNRPIFTRPPTESTTYRINEESEYNATVMTVLVVNPDNTPVPGVRYYLANTTDRYYFTIDPNSGRVYVQSSPDRETQHTYQLIVVARTNTTEVSRKFFVNLNDIDDNYPRFRDCGDLEYPVVIRVTEQEGTGESVIGRITACDKDDSENSATFYHLVQCADGSTSTQASRFSINLLTGEITADTRTLDYEQATSHTLCVNASTSQTDASLNSDQWKVVINVTDRDDNVLQFLQSTVSVVISGSVGTGQSIVQIRATDLDIVSPTGILYQIISTDFINGSQVINGTNNATIRNAFTIDQYTGKVSTSLASYLGLIGGRFVMKIRAQTNTDSKDMQLTVFVNHPAEQLVLVIDRTPEEVSEFIRDLFDGLEEIHGYKFVDQRTTYHQDPDNQQTNMNMTNVYMYVLDKNGNLVDSDTVAEILQAGYDKRQDELYKKYDVVIGGDPSTRVSRESRQVFDWFYYEWIWWIIIICAIVLIIDALILILCLQYFFNKYIK